MTQEQFTRAVQINDMLKDLQDVKNVLNEKNVCLSFVNRSTGRVLPGKVLTKISLILESYDMKVRDSIDKEISRLQQEINEL